MKKLEFCDSAFKEIDCAICIGVFDGMHLGHDAIFRTCIGEAEKLGCKSVCVTFSRNPKMATGSMNANKALTSGEEMEKVLAKYGFDYHCVIDFSDDMSKLSGWEFMSLLCTSYRVRALVAGKSFRCGSRDRSFGNAEISEFLRSRVPDARLASVPSVFIGDEEVSSTLVRKSLLSGDMEHVSRLLGRPYSLRLPKPSAVEDEGLRLLYDVRAVGQLLPCDGLYDVYATGFSGAAGDSVPAESKAVLEVSGGVPVLDLPVRMQAELIYFLQERNNGYKGTETGDYR